MSASAHHPPWGRASDTDPGGTGTRQLQGAWARKRVFNTPTPGLYRHDVVSGTTWAGVAVDLVRDNTKEAAKDTAIKADIERKKSNKEIRNEENVEDDKEEVTYPEFITDDEEAEDDGSIYTTLADKKQIDEVVNEASKMRKERIKKQIEGWNNLDERKNHGRNNGNPGLTGPPGHGPDME